MVELTKLKKSGYNPVKEEDIIRKCASIISKKDGKLEIIDSVSFKTFEADIAPELLEQADENDQVTYILSGKTAKVVEIRK